METNVISLSVTDRRIKATDHVKPTAGNVAHDVVAITLDSEWDALDKRVTFYRDGVEVTLPYAAEIEVPWEVLTEPGTFGVTVVGSKDGKDRLVTAAMPMSERIRVSTNGEDEGVDPKQPTEDILVSAIKATERANEVSERVEGAEAQREAAFDEAQAQRSEQFAEAQQTHSNAFDGDMAAWAQEVAQKVAEAATAAQAANNAANNISQRADSGEFNGAPFEIKYTPTSIAAMNAITGARQGEFAVINSNVEDPDNAKLFMFGNGGWNYMSDLSGATGFGLQGKQGVSLKNVEVRNATQVWVTQYDPMTEQERTYMIGDFAQPLAAGVSGYVDSKWQVVDAMPENPVPGVVYFVRE